MTNHELGVMLSGVPEPYGHAPLGWSFGPGEWRWVHDFEYIVPVNSPYTIVYLLGKQIFFPGQNVRTAWGFGAYLDVLPEPLASRHVFVLTYLGLQEITGIRFFQIGENQELPVVGLVTTVSPPQPFPTARNRRDKPPLSPLPDQRAAPESQLPPPAGLTLNDLVAALQALPSGQQGYGVYYRGPSGALVPVARWNQYTQSGMLPPATTVLRGGTAPKPAAQLAAQLAATAPAFGDYPVYAAAGGYAPVTSVAASDDRQAVILALGPPAFPNPVVDP